MGLDSLDLAIIGGIGLVATLVIEASGDKIADAIRETNTQPTYELRVENVLGESAPEKFYEINGQRVFLEIDGRPVSKLYER